MQNDGESHYNGEFSSGPSSLAVLGMVLDPFVDIVLFVPGTNKIGVWSKYI